MHQGLTTVQSARVVGELHWAASRLFEVLGRWAAEADRPDVAMSMATSSRHLGWHADDLEALLPDSTLLEDDAKSGPHSEGVDAAVEAIRAIPGSVERLAVAHRVLLPRMAARCVSIERASGHHCDASLARVLSFLLADLRRDRDDGEALLGRLLTDVDSVEQANARVLEAESRLVAAGGLLPVGIGD
ncbi:MAG: hypothetical protein R2707_15585 [Acidimicrobiales bacterium]